MSSIHPQLAAITARIRTRSAPTRQRYLDAIAAVPRAPARRQLSCGNLAHGFAASDAQAKTRLRGGATPNIAIVSAYNDMLSAHQPFEGYPALIRQTALAAGATAQVAGGVPAMCDGITQGQPGMELSLFSRDVIAQATAIALSHGMFDGGIYLGVCDKIVPGMLIGALAFGHLPAIFVPAGPMPSGISNQAKAKVRERYAAGQASKEELLEAEAASYHAPGTCTFYGTANSNQLLLEAMGLMLPGAAFVNPATPLRAALTRAATLRAIEISTLGSDCRPLGELVDERAIVNALAVLLATGGSTNHSIHWVAVARAAGIIMNWTDLSELSALIPLLVRMYPNGDADVNRFASAGGIGFVLRELLDAGLLHGDARGVQGTLQEHARVPQLDGHGSLHWGAAAASSSDGEVLRGVADAFEPHGGLRLVQGNLGRALVKIAALKPEQRRIRAAAVVLHDQHELAQRHAAGTLPQDFVAVLRFQGPHANGMPELHSMTPLLGHMQSQGRQVALVTDGRLSGASGKTLSAIHLSPEAARGGLLAKVREGDTVHLDAEAGVLELDVAAAELAARDAVATSRGGGDVGRRLFGHNRAQVLDAEQGALSIALDPADCDSSADALPHAGHGC